MGKLTGKVALVTGASKGIGAEIAKMMASEGAKVIVNFASDKDAADSIVENINQTGGTALAIKADVSKSQEVKSLFEEAHKHFGSLDILVNNAGVYKFEPAFMVTETEFHRQFDSNVLGTILCIQNAMPYFNEKGASIINISSVASIKAGPMTLVYAASKAAVDSITRTLSKELGAKNIRVNSILPGPTQTEGNPIIGSEMEAYVVANTPLGRIGKPQDMANVAVFLASDDALWITGQKIAVSGGFD